MAICRMRIACWIPKATYIRSEYVTFKKGCTNTPQCYILRKMSAFLCIIRSIPGGVTSDFFLGSFRQNHVPWGRLSFSKWVPGISPGVKAAGTFGWRSTTLVVPKVEKIRGLNLPGTPTTISVCRGILYFTLYGVSLDIKILTHSLP